MLQVEWTTFSKGVRATLSRQDSAGMTSRSGRSKKKRARLTHAERKRETRRGEQIETRRAKREDTLERRRQQTGRARRSWNFWLCTALARCTAKFLDRVSLRIESPGRRTHRAERRPTTSHYRKNTRPKGNSAKRAALYIHNRLLLSHVYLPHDGRGPFVWPVNFKRERIIHCEPHGSSSQLVIPIDQCPEFAGARTGIYRQS